jgi:hypothetical protein
MIKNVGSKVIQTVLPHAFNTSSDVAKNVGEKLLNAINSDVGKKVSELGQNLVQRAVETGVEKISDRYLGPKVFVDPELRNPHVFDEKPDKYNVNPDYHEDDFVEVPQIRTKPKEKETAAERIKRMRGYGSCSRGRGAASKRGRGIKKKQSLYTVL